MTGEAQDARSDVDQPGSSVVLEVDGTKLIPYAHYIKVARLHEDRARLIPAIWRVHAHHKRQVSEHIRALTMRTHLLAKPAHVLKVTGTAGQVEVDESHDVLLFADGCSDNFKRAPNR
jgi:hypothetical protein